MGENATLSPRQLTRWMKGDVGRPRPVTRRVAERFWDHSLEVLLGPAEVRAAVQQPDGGLGRQDLLRRVDDAGLEPRLVSPGLQGVPAWEEIVAQQSMDFATRARRSAMDPTVLDDLEMRLRRISWNYLYAPHPRAHFSELTVVRDHAFRQIESERPRPDQSRQLHALAGIACALLAQSTHELGFRRAAMTHAQAAFVCAEMAGFDSLQVWVRATQAAIAEYAGLPIETVRYAEAGQAHTSRGTSLVRLLSLAANGHARMGDLAAARKALAAAERARDAVADSDPLDAFGGVLSVSLAKQHAYAASALALLHQGPAATEEATRALELYQAVQPHQRQPVNEAYAHIDVAFGRVLSGELDAVGDALEPVLALPVHARVDLLDEKLRRVHRQLAEGAAMGSHPRAVRDVQGKIEEFVATVNIPAVP
jgi:hypothetical protein